MKLNISSFAKLAGVSVRTLHYYDEIGLLAPDYVDKESGYRYYGYTALNRMQEILFYRELDFPLAIIKEIITSPDYNKKYALDGQKKLLILKKERLERIIKSIECAEKGEKIMDLKAFDNSEIETTKKLFKEEAQLRWGKTSAYKENMMKTKDYSDEDWENVKNKLDSIFEQFSVKLKLNTASDDSTVQELVKNLQSFITETQYNCTDEILMSLGEMYTADDRFRKNIDKHGEGTAQFVSDSIKVYCSIK